VLRAEREGELLRRQAGRESVRMPVGGRIDSAQADAALWRDLHERLSAFVARRMPDAHAAQDVAQDVLLRLHRSLGDLRNEDRLDAFAYSIARNAIIDHYRARAGAREAPAPPEQLIPRLELEAGDDDEVGGRRELACCLEPLVAELPDAYREALRLTDLGDLSQVQAAKVAGLSVPGMKARVQRARAQLREVLTECCTVALDAGQRITDVQRTRSCSCAAAGDSAPACA
jgi:RNA polymerase sigma-70 factor (ECF subfamily)